MRSKVKLTHNGSGSINMEMNATTQKPVVIPTVNSLNKLQWEKKITRAVLDKTYTCYYGNKLRMQRSV